MFIIIVIYYTTGSNAYRYRKCRNYI